VRLKQLQLSNFRNHVASTLKFADNNFIVVRGLNHSGKSTIGQAISMLLTPTTDGLDEQGRGFIAKIRRGQQKSTIIGDIQGASHVIQQAVTLNTNTSGRTAKATCLDDQDWHPLPFEGFLEFRRSALGVALNTDKFLLTLDEARQKALLASLVLPQSYEFPEDKVQAVDRLIGGGVIDFTGNPLVAIEKAYAKLYAERTTANRQVRDFSIPDEIPIPEGGGSKELQEQLNRIRENKREIERSRDAAIKAGSDIEIKRTRIQGRIETLESKIREETEHLQRATSQILSAAKSKAHKKTAEGKPKLEALDRERSELAGTIRTLREETARFDALPDAGTTCVTCGQIIDAERQMKIGTELTSKLQAALRRDTDILREMQDLGDVAGAIIALTAHDAAEESKKSTESILAEKTKLQRAAQAELADLPEKVDASIQFVEPLKAIEIDIDLMIAKLRPIIAAEERVEEIKRKRAELDKLQEKASTLNDLVKYFDKDGIKADLLKEHIGSFTKKINSVLQAWGYACEFSIEPYEFIIITQQGPTPIDQVSYSERLMFSIALQCAVSQVAGIGIVVADRMDTFLPEERAKANACLYAMVQDGILEQVFLIVSSDESGDVPKIPGAAFFLVENGTVSSL